jgi:[acyl-carrier-protein] S-malonyltransferase
VSYFFLFPGQGSQKPGMGRDFRDRSAAARRVFDEAADHDAVGPQLLETMFNGPAEALTQTRTAQLALLVMEVAVARHLEDGGIEPAGCAGHSLGEFSALVIARSLAFNDALDLVSERGRLMGEAPAGAMAAVMGLAADAIEAALPAGATVANYNGPQQTIITGSEAAIAEAENALKEAGARRVMKLNVSGAFHSPMMDEAARSFAELVDRVELQKPLRRFVSSVTGDALETTESIRHALGHQMRAPVRWTDVMRTVGAETRAVEAGPGNVLAGIAKRMDGAPQVTPAGTLEQAEALLTEQA